MPHTPRFGNAMIALSAVLLLNVVCLLVLFSPQPPFQGGRPGLDDLAGLDSQLHSNLLAVKACPAEDVESLGLTFSVEQQLFGKVCSGLGFLFVVGGVA